MQLDASWPRMVAPRSTLDRPPPRAAGTSDAARTALTVLDQVKLAQRQTAKANAHTRLLGIKRMLEALGRFGGAAGTVGHLATRLAKDLGAAADAYADASRDSRTKEDERIDRGFTAMAWGALGRIKGIFSIVRGFRNMPRHELDQAERTAEKAVLSLTAKTNLRITV